MNKPVLQIDKWSDTTINVFPNAYQAGKTLSIHGGNISRCAKGKVRTAGGFRWKYASLPKPEACSKYCQKCANKERELFMVCGGCL